MHPNVPAAGWYLSFITASQRHWQGCRLRVWFQNVCKCSSDHIVFSSLNMKHMFCFLLLPYVILTQWRALRRQAADEIPRPLDKSNGQNQWRGRVWCKFPSVWKHCLPHLTQLIMKLSLMSINSPTLVSPHRLSILRETRGWHYCDSIAKIRSCYVHTLAKSISQKPFGLCYLWMLL